jgi:SAM-dependent methyltransferase
LDEDISRQKREKVTRRGSRGDAVLGRKVTRYWREGAWLAREAPARLWRQHADVIHRDLLERWLPEQTGVEPDRPRVLKTDLYEEAVGIGQTDWLSERCVLLAGVDLASDVAAAASRARSGRLCAAVADTRELPFPDRSFDVVVSLSTLDHFATPEAIPEALAELARVLHPGGLLLLTLDNPANPIVWLRQALPFPLLRRLGIVPYFCGPSLHPRRVRAVLQSAGFEVDDLTAVMHCPRALAVLLAACLDRFASATTGRAFLGALRAFERLGRLPSRYLTGYFVAARCVRRP